MTRSILSSCWRTLYAGTWGLMLGGMTACGLMNYPAPANPQTPPAVPQPPTPPATGIFDAPPPVSGGTLMLTHDGTTAVAADPDRDSVWLVNLASQVVRTRVRLPSHSEPGRVVEDNDGKVHVALRRSGQVAKIDPQTGAIELMRPACAAPRGLGYDPATDDLHIACVGGELVTMKARGGDTTRQLSLDNDLRDIAVKGDHLLISRFRTAELIEIDASGVLVGRVKPAVGQGLGAKDGNGMPMTASPTTAWRTTMLPTGEVLMLHQRATDGTITTKGGGYGNGPCPESGIVGPSLTLFSDAQSPAGVGNSAMLTLLALAVDVAASPDGELMALVGPTVNSKSPGMAFFKKDQLGPGSQCQLSGMLPVYTPPNVQPVAAAFDSQGLLWVQSPEPASLSLWSPAASYPQTTIPFTEAEPRSDVGHALFHNPTPALIACVSCHAEGGDDSHLWNFDTVGARRTQSLRGGILATAPFHWDGEMTDLNTLMSAVFVGRMAGLPPTADTVDAVGKWLDAQQPAGKAAPADAAAVERGRAVFTDSSVGCANCHSGAHYTNNQNADVGTGRSFQVPSLIDVASRAPFLHNGCAATLRDRFNPACGGGDQHGHTSQLTSGQIDDVVAFLQTL